MAVNYYAVVGQGWIADGTGTTNSTRRLVPGVNNINITQAGNLTVTMCCGTSASAASDVATVTSSPVSCPQAAATVITVTGTGNIKITVTYGSTGLVSSAYTWSATSGGISNAGTPTSVDNVFCDAKTFTATGQNLTPDTATIGFNMDWTGALYSPTFAYGISNPKLYGSLTCISAMSCTAQIVFSATSSQTITMGGCQPTTGPLWTFDGVGGTWTLQDDFIMPLAGGPVVYLNHGTLIWNGHTLSTGAFSANYATSNTLTMGSGILNCTSFAANALTTITANTGTINDSGNFDGGGINYNGATLNPTGATCTITGSNTINITLPSATTQTITFSDGTTQTGTSFSLSGSSGHVHTLQGSSTGGWNITKAGGGEVDCHYVSISYCTGNPVNTFYGASTTNTNGGHNTNWYWAYSLSLSEGTTSGESLTPLKNTYPSLSESLTAGENLALIKKLSVSLAEGLTIADAISIVKKLSVSIAEILTTGDTLIPVKTTKPSLSEGLTAGDSVSMIKKLVVSLSEGLLETDALTVLKKSYPTISEGLSETDTLLVWKISNVSISEGVTLADALILWAALIKYLGGSKLGIRDGSGSKLPKRDIGGSKGI